MLEMSVRLCQQSYVEVLTVAGCASLQTSHIVHLSMSPLIPKQSDSIPQETHLNKFDPWLTNYSGYPHFATGKTLRFSYSTRLNDWSSSLSLPWTIQLYNCNILYNAATSRVQRSPYFELTIYDAYNQLPLTPKPNLGTLMRSMN